MTVRMGRTPSGARFDVPVTPDMFVTLINPLRWGPAEMLSILFIVFTLLLFLIRRLLPIPVPIYVAIFLFWRISYNVGIGLTLHAQSKDSLISKAVAAASPKAKALLNWFATGSMPRDFAWSKCPIEFNAWLAFRAISIIILSNDGLSYIILAIVCFRPLSESHPITLLFCFSLGGALIALSLWAKAAAHACLGDFAWYWGDFFFLIDSELVFDGVFRLFPHPMYTVGYAAYYGASLITRSHTLFVVSVLAHAGQILFLLLVEEPHIQFLYGPKPERKSRNTVSDGDEEDERITPASPSLFSRTPLLFSSAYFPLTMIVVTVAALFLLTRPSLPVIVMIFLFWRIIHCFGLGYILAHQATHQIWTNHYLRNGFTTQMAYDNWRHIWTLSYVLNHLMFVWLAFSVPPSADANWTFIPSARAMSRITGSIALILIALYSQWSAYCALGDFGFNYGDFFLLPRNDTPVYNGVFRYLNNPEAALGYLAYYGLALWRQSFLLLFFAVISQMLHFVFVRQVEMPHMLRKYSSVRPASQITRAATVQGVRLATAVPIVRTVGNGLRRRANRSTAAIYGRATRQGAAVRDSFARSQVQAAASFGKHKLSGTATNLSARVLAKLSSFDSTAIVANLMKFGLTVEPIAEANGISEDCAVADSKRY